MTGNTIEAASLDTRLERIESMLKTLVDGQTIREWYSIEEFARLVDRSEFTCREWCRLGRIVAQKKGSGRGRHASWVISHDELTRFRKDGLRPTWRTIET